MKSVQKPNKFVVKETILVILNNYLLCPDHNPHARLVPDVTVTLELGIISFMRDP